MTHALQFWIKHSTVIFHSSAKHQRWQSTIDEGNNRTLANSSIPRLQVRSLCSDWSVGADKLYQLLNVMEAVDLLRIIRKEHDTKQKQPAKNCFFPILHSIQYWEKRRNAREAMTAMLCTAGGFLCEAVKDETTGDFVCQTL
jgi:hypothetical protein